MASLRRNSRNTNADNNSTNKPPPPDRRKKNASEHNQHARVTHVRHRIQSQNKKKSEGPIDFDPEPNKTYNVRKVEQRRGDVPENRTRSGTQRTRQMEGGRQSEGGDRRERDTQASKQTSETEGQRQKIQGQERVRGQGRGLGWVG